MSVEIETTEQGLPYYYCENETKPVELIVSRSHWYQSENRLSLSKDNYETSTVGCGFDAESNPAVYLPAVAAVETAHQQKIPYYTERSIESSII